MNSPSRSLGLALRFLTSIASSSLLRGLSSLLLFAAPLLHSQTTGGLLPVGVASIDITPHYPIRLSGYGGRRTSSDGVEQSLFAKALAIGTTEGGPASLVLTVDNTGVPEWITDEVFRQLSASSTLQRAQFVICSSHTHTGPMLKGVLPNLFSQDLTAEESATIERYSGELVKQLVEVGLVALRGMTPCEVSWGQGRASFARNRRTKGGPVDHDLPVMSVRAPDGSLKALWVNYACHCTTLGGDFNRHCGDWAGYAQERLEKQFPGARALVSVGCGGDSDPQPRNALEPAKQHGAAIATEVERVLKLPMTRLSQAPHGEFRRFMLAFDTLPTREEWERRSRLQDITGYHARLNLARLDRGEALPTELPYTVQTWSFGRELAMVFLAGEVVVDYSLRLKNDYKHDHVWVNAYANDVPCYIPSRRIWQEGGYEGGGAMPYYDRPTRLAADTEDRIFAQLEPLIPAAFKDPDAGKGTPPSKSPGEALRAFRTQPGFEVDLVASEPLVIDPVAIDFGADGRLWVAEMHDYPSGMDGKFKPGGRLKVLSDTDGDGKFDRAETWVEDLPFPTGVMAWNRGVLVCAAPDILYLEDADGDGRAEIRKVLFSGFATHNFQARVNSLRWGLDGWVYGAAGLFGGTIHSHLTGRDHELSGRDFRIHPDTGEFEAVSGISQQGRARNDFGDWFGCDNGSWIWHFPFPEESIARNPSLSLRETRIYAASQPNANELYPASRTLERFNDPDNANRTTSACGLEIYRDGFLGAGFRGSAFIGEPVHNLVRRFTVQPSGVTFLAEKPLSEGRTEFLSSTDNWFRPVELRTGPDGCLWVVDMYRFVIEHPRWIPADRLAKLDPRAGDQQGRVYRVKPSGASPSAAWGNLERMGFDELATRFGSGNGILRDLVHRLWLKSDDAKINPWLAAWVSSGDETRDVSGAIRVQALHLLQQRGALSPSLLDVALTSRNAEIRRIGIQLCERNPIESSPLLSHLSQLTDDPETFVRFQLALSLGAWKEVAAGKALSKLLQGHSEDSRFRSAILSSAMSHVPELLGAALRMPENVPTRSAWVAGLLATASRSGSEMIRESALDQFLPRAGEKVTLSHLQVATSLLPARGVEPASGDLATRLSRMRDWARGVARDAQRAAGDRRTAILFLSRATASAEDIPIFQSLLQQDSPPDLQKIAVEVLSQSRDGGANTALVADWATKPAGLRRATLEAMLNRDPGASQLLTELQAQRIPTQDLNPSDRQRLLMHPDATISRRAHELFAGSGGARRVDVLRRYAQVDTLKGDPVRGLSRFAELCAGCHAVRGLGVAVGPDLSTYRPKPAVDFVVAILDPNAVVEPRFRNFTVETKDDRTLVGVVQNESANSLTLVQAGGHSETLLRSEIRKLEASALSLMPEGFESVLDPQAMSDLIAYLKSNPPRTFGSANRTIEQQAIGELSAMNREGGVTVQFASERLDYRGVWGLWPLLHCRLWDGTAHLDWETPPPVDGRKEGRTRVVLPVAMGLRSQPEGTFSLFLNEKKAFDFDVALGDATWESPTLPVRARYLVKENNAEDSNGLLWLEVDNESLPPGKPLHWTVRTSRSNSQRWFGIYAVPPFIAAPAPNQRRTGSPLPSSK